MEKRKDRAKGKIIVRADGRWARCRSRARVRRKISGSCENFRNSSRCLQAIVDLPCPFSRVRRADRRAPPVSTCYARNGSGVIRAKKRRTVKNLFSSKARVDPRFYMAPRLDPPPPPNSTPIRRSVHYQRPTVSPTTYPVTPSCIHAYAYFLPSPSFSHGSYLHACDTALSTRP